MHDGFMRCAVEKGHEFGAQKRRRLERAVGVEILREGPVARARSVSRGRIDRLGFAAKALRRAGVDQEQRVAVEARAKGRGIYRRRDAADSERSRDRLRDVGGQYAAL